MEFDKEVELIDWDFKTNLLKTLSMKKAVEFAYKNSKVGQFVLLSTWAPSFNENWVWCMPWKTYIEKWELFKKYVKEFWK